MLPPSGAALAGGIGEKVEAEIAKHLLTDAGAPDVILSKGAELRAQYTLPITVDGIKKMSRVVEASMNRALTSARLDERPGMKYELRAC